MYSRKIFSHVMCVICVLGAFAVASTSVALSKENLRIVWPYNIPSLDASGSGVIRSTWGISWHVYDRLFTYEIAEIAPGVFHDDHSELKGELAESWSFSEDGKTLTIDIRDATFHDGSKVTAEDVVWSIRRAMALPTSAGVMAAGGLSDPAQLRVLDENTLTITFSEPNRLVLPILTVPMAPVINADLAKSHASESDPWAAEWLKTNTAGGGAYMVDRFRNEQIVLSRFDDWKSGPLPTFEQAVFIQVPESSTRAALVERDSADLAVILTPRDLQGVMDRGDAKVLAIPMGNHIEYIGFNSRKPPFDDPRVRQAIAYAIPFEGIFKNILGGRGNPLFGGDAEVTEVNFPQRHRYHQDLEKARQLLAEAGYPDGLQFELSLCTCEAESFEPIAVAIKDALGKIGVDAVIAKKPAAQFGQTIVEKTFEVTVNNVISWVTSPDYWFEVFYMGEQRSNYGNFKSEKLETLLKKARTTTNDAEYNEANVEMTNLVLEQIPLLFIRNGAFEIALSDNIETYTYWFHTLPDVRYMN